MVDEISSKIAAFPGLYEKAKNVLPRAINEVRLHIKELQEKDIDLSYLEPEEKLTTIQNALATSTIDRLVDYCMNTPKDDYRTQFSVEKIKALVAKNKQTLSK